MEKILKVSQINAYVKLCLESEDVLHNIYVEGEISNFIHHNSGHMYFSLKDSSSAIKCICFRGNANRLKYIPKNGMKVIVQGNISVYERDGVYQIYVNNITPKGEGEIALGIEQLKKKLLKEGLFDEEKKNILPQFVKKVGVISAETGAVIKDICNVAFKRNPFVNVILYPAFVQGELASKSIIKGISFFTSKYKVDIIIIARGGGSKEDLWCFNEENLVRAISKCKIPIITAIGHETDTTLVDYASDMRAATPSQAAEIAIPELKVLQGNLKVTHEKLNILFNNKLTIFMNNLQNMVKNTLLTNPMPFFEYKLSKIEYEKKILHLTFQNNLDRNNNKLSIYATKLEIYNPISTLKRGFTTINQNGHDIIKLSMLNKNEIFTINFWDGKCSARIVNDNEGVEQSNGKEKSNL